LIKPLDSLRLQRAATAIMNGGTYTEGVPVVDVPVEHDEHDSSEEVATTAG
jgi:hypothetical protein